MKPGALRLSAPQEELPSRPIGEFESYRSSWLSLLSPLIFPLSSSRSGLSPAFAREWLFYIGTVELDASHRKLLFTPAAGAESLIRIIPNTRMRGETHNLRASPCEVRERIEIHASYGGPWSRTAAGSLTTSNTLIIYDAGLSFRVTPRVYCSLSSRSTDPNYSRFSASKKYLGPV